VQIGEAYTDHMRDQRDHAEAQLDFKLTYGLPGKPDYAYTRPFDYFDFQFTASAANYFESILSRGLLLGTEYGSGDNYRGIWGLYGSYDYISPQTFRISSTALSSLKSIDFSGFEDDGLSARPRTRTMRRS
jgi:hypothetical protein